MGYYVGQHEAAADRLLIGRLLLLIGVVAVAVGDLSRAIDRRRFVGVLVLQVLAGHRVLSIEGVGDETSTSRDSPRRRADADKHARARRARASRGERGQRVEGR